MELKSPGGRSGKRKIIWEKGGGGNKKKREKKLDASSEKYWTFIPFIRLIESPALSFHFHGIMQSQAAPLPPQRTPSPLVWTCWVQTSRPDGRQQVSGINHFDVTVAICSVVLPKRQKERTASPFSQRFCMSFVWELSAWLCSSTAHNVQGLSGGPSSFPGCSRSLTARCVWHNSDDK